MTMRDLAKQYTAVDVEARIYEFWLKHDLFKAKSGKTKNYTIIMPPPNVTGVLHMGHALTCTLEDILIRLKRMQGFNALWLPGTDHAGIATQMVVERKLLSEEKRSRHDLGREEFLKRVWQWKEASQNTILSQMRVMGCSVDWSRLCFTLDPKASLAVRTAFVSLFKEGLIERMDAMIQWCPRCKTALSDLEVKFVERRGKLWHIRYPLKDDPARVLVVATTRPETLLGDTAVAVHPQDDRYQPFHGKQVTLPLALREIPVVTDEYVDKSFGSGVVKITPGHDPNDYQLGKRHGLSILTILDEAARVSLEGSPYHGLSREKARERILGDLTRDGLLVKEEDHVSNVGTCDRCGTVVEPRVSLQWFVKADVLAPPAIYAVETGKVRIIPKEWEKTYFEWMRNIRPWCISRQLWWGHRIPVWYCKQCPAVLAWIQPKANCDQCGSTEIFQDEDVLDTWFSSGLWPISTLGWPEETLDLRSFYPSQVMETGFDILFFWVARMIMLGMHFRKEAPFEVVFLHPMVRDEYGQKMSKTKGNVVDPLEIVKSKGTDALRFTLCAMAVHGRDVLLSDNRIEGYRNFINKLWNAARFVCLHFGDIDREAIRVTDPVNQWILTRLARVTRELNSLWEEYRFFEAAEKLYHFIWNDYCDYFLEFIKRKGELESRKGLRDSTAVSVLEQALRLLHPIIPFVTEELWQNMPLRGPEVSIAIAKYPKALLLGEFPEGESRVKLAIEVIEGIRKIRGENDLRLSEKVEVQVFGEEEVKAQLRPMMDAICDLGGCSRLTLLSPEEEVKYSQASLVVLKRCNLRCVLPQGRVADPTAAREQIDDLRKSLAATLLLLAKPGFAEKAPADVVEREREKAKELTDRIAALERTLAFTNP